MGGDSGDNDIDDNIDRSAACSAETRSEDGSGAVLVVIVVLVVNEDGSATMMVEGTATAIGVMLESGTVGSAAIV